MSEFIGGMPQIGGMANRNPVTLLLSEARTKTHIREMVEKVDDLTFEEIDSLPQTMPWHRDALKKLKQLNRSKEVEEEAGVYADQMGEIIILGPVYGSLVKYIGDDTNYIPPRGLQIIIKHGAHFFVTSDMTWYDAIPLGMPRLPVEVVKQNITREQYADFVLTGVL